MYWPGQCLQLFGLELYRERSAIVVVKSLTEMADIEYGFLIRLRWFDLFVYALYSKTENRFKRIALQNWALWQEVKNVEICLAVATLWIKWGWKIKSGAPCKRSTRAPVDFHCRQGLRTVFLGQEFSKLIYVKRDSDKCKSKMFYLFLYQEGRIFIFSVARFTADCVGLFEHFWKASKDNATMAEPVDSTLPLVNDNFCRIGRTDSINFFVNVMFNSVSSKMFPEQI